ncbi:unnamed protein product [Spirodela intermedia]|uniref:Apyrase 7 n=1 Tax=Spirodela intermedia TaxID=51605 RepID=A0ABN7EB68_SPIIN|nr:unnamed protein product [Spirodela intermedia]
MRLSSSLQDLSSFSRLDPERGRVEFEIEGSYARPQASRVLIKESGGSSFSKEKPLPETPFWRRRWIRIPLFALGLLLLFSFLYACSLSFSRYWSQNSSKYYVVLDCGSTGTRAYVYECSIDHKKGRYLPIHLKSLPESIGQISSSQSGRAYQRMETEPGFDKLVRNESGLRNAIHPLLRWAEKQIPKHAHKSTSLFVYATAGVRRLPSSDSKLLLDTVWSILKSYSFLCQRGWIKTISGMDEAFYGWIALNYQMGTIASVPPKIRLVTFETSGVIPGETGLNLSIGDIRHHLSAYSLSGYGLNDAFDKSVVHLLRKQSAASLKDGKVALKHPCLHDGYREQYICRQCAPAGKGRGPLVGVRTSDKGQIGIPVTLVGEPGGRLWCTCQDNSEFVCVVGRCKEQRCSSQPFIDQYCFRAPYVASLLRDGLHIDDNKVSIGSGSTTWTLGVALLGASQALSSKIHLYGYGIPYPEISRPWIPRFFQRSYFPVFRHGNGTSSSIRSLPYPFAFQRWNPINSDATEPHNLCHEQRPFGVGHGLGGSCSQLSESSLHPSGGVSHSYSSGSLGQMPQDSVVAPFWTSHRSQMQLQSRRSQSREDLSSSLAEIHMKG